VSNKSVTVGDLVTTSKKKLPSNESESGAICHAESQDTAHSVASLWQEGIMGKAGKSKGKKNRRQKHAEAELDTSIPRSFVIGKDVPPSVQQLVRVFPPWQLDWLSLLLFLPLLSHAHHSRNHLPNYMDHPDTVLHHLCTPPRARWGILVSRVCCIRPAVEWTLSVHTTQSRSNSCSCSRCRVSALASRSPRLLHRLHPLPVSVFGQSLA
jgi:hypothetical protein